MKIFFILFLLFCIMKPQDRLKGKYKMEYDYNYSQHNGNINFEDNTYTRVQLNGKKTKGVIGYQQYFIILNDKKSNLQVQFPKREIGNDTIYFRTTDLSKPEDEDVLSVYGGKLIKIK